ncbi:PadR family transcriptional regulator [Streptomyces xiamenensis]|uniref:Transcriptional regulator, PadR family n=1 Tax=Streptomyces xiamenensis TaxID=408015 RepID=A0A0F7FXI5_9ACTN|nr:MULTISPECIES: PadR family transcriptional regulator [Streptomyces]AKG45408.1 putative transcriptional regulator, PadR family [Streptomyces xiamenensis]
MPPVFGHGRLRLYLLKLLDESPRHGYEVIRLLEERFQGRYAPSAGTVYPRLAKLAAEGLVTHTEEGGRKVYSLTGEGRRELADRADELAALEREINASLTALADGIREDVSGSAHDLRQEMRQATARARGAGAGAGAGAGSAAGWRDEARRARREAKQAREEVRTEFEQAAQRLQEQVRSHAAAGDWQGAVRVGLDGLSHGLNGWGHGFSTGRTPWMGGHEAPSGPTEHADSAESAQRTQSRESGAERTEPAHVADPARELERLLDKFRDDIRDAARDHGVTQTQLATARTRLADTATEVLSLLRHSDAGRDSTR